MLLLLQDVQVGWMEALPFPAGLRGWEMLDAASLTALESSRSWRELELLCLPTSQPCFRSVSGDVPVQWRVRKRLLPGMPSHHPALTGKDSFDNRNLTIELHLHHHSHLGCAAVTL